MKPPSSPKVGTTFIQKNPYKVFQFDGVGWQELKRDEVKSARQRLFSALQDLDEEMGEVENAGTRNLRKQAVIDVVNALYPREPILFKIDPHKYESTNPYVGCARCGLGPGSIQHNMEEIR